MGKNNILGRWRYKWAWIDFQQDGMSKKERIKGKNKRILRKKSQRKLLEAEKKIYNQVENEMKVTGWTYWHYEDDLKHDQLIDWLDYCWTNRLSDSERLAAHNVVIQELRENNYHMTGSTHQNWDYGVPILDDKFVFQLSERSWGDLMFDAYPTEDYSAYEDHAKAENKPYYYYNYLKWSFVCPKNEEEIIPRADEVDPWEDFDWCYECMGYGDDYSIGDDGELHSNCDRCPHNTNSWED